MTGRGVLDDPAPGPEHVFTVTVNLRGAGADWSTDLVVQQVEAYDLAEALRLLTLIPFPQWFPEEDR